MSVRQQGRTHGRTPLTTSTDTDAAAVLATLEQVYAAWAANDAAAFAEPYLDDATVVLPGVLHRRAAVRDHMTAGFAGPLKASCGIDEPQDAGASATRRSSSAPHGSSWRGRGTCPRSGPCSPRGCSRGGPAGG